MGNERDSEQFKQQPTDQSKGSGQPIDQSKSEQPIGQSSEAQGGQQGQQPSSSGEQQSSDPLTSGETMTEQKGGSQWSEPTGQVQGGQTSQQGQTGQQGEGQFMSQQGQDSGEYLRKDETDKSDSDIEGSSGNFGTNGE